MNEATVLDILSSREFKIFEQVYFKLFREAGSDSCRLSLDVIDFLLTDDAHPRRRKKWDLSLRSMFELDAQEHGEVVKKIYWATREAYKRGSLPLFSIFFPIFEKRLDKGDLEFLHALKKDMEKPVGFSRQGDLKISIVGAFYDRLKSLIKKLEPQRLF